MLRWHGRSSSSRVTQQQQQQPPEIRAVAVSPHQTGRIIMLATHARCPRDWHSVERIIILVVHSFVRVRKTPEVLGVELGLLKKGAIVSVDAIHNDWVRLEEEPSPGYRLRKGSGGSTSLAGGWMLTDGKSLSNFTAVKLGHYSSLASLLPPREPSGR